MGWTIGKAGEVTPEVPCVFEVKNIEDKTRVLLLHDGKRWTFVEIDTLTTGQWAGPLAPSDDMWLS